MSAPTRQGLYDPRNEHDACGVGFVANIKGRKSHDIIARGLQILVNLDHRGAVGADPLVGDGAGCLIQMPDALLRHWAGGRRARPAAARPLCRRDVLPAARTSRRATSRSAHFEHFVARRGPGPGRLARRADRHHRARRARSSRRCRGSARRSSPRAPTIADQDAFERKILTIRKQTLNSVAALADEHGLPALRELYMPSFSTRTVVYKGLLLAPQVGSFYEDLRNPLTRLGAGAGASALLDQHLPVLAARAPLPLHLPQRRDQHGARQRQLDGGAPPGDVVGPARPRPRQDGAADRRPANRTPPASTTRSNCWSSAAAIRSPMR